MYALVKHFLMRCIIISQRKAIIIKYFINSLHYVLRNTFLLKNWSRLCKYFSPWSLRTLKFTKLYTELCNSVDPFHLHYIAIIQIFNFFFSFFFGVFLMLFFYENVYTLFIEIISILFYFKIRTVFCR